MRWSRATATCCRSDATRPEAFVHFAGLVFQERSGDGNRLLATKRRLRGRAGRGLDFHHGCRCSASGRFPPNAKTTGHQRQFTKRGTAWQGFGAGVEGAAGKRFFRCSNCAACAQASISARRVGILGPHGIVACSNYCFAPLVDNQCAKRMAPRPLRASRAVSTPASKRSDPVRSLVPWLSPPLSRKRKS